MLSLTCDNFRVFGGRVENYAIHIYTEQQIPFSLTRSQFRFKRKTFRYFLFVNQKIH